MIRPTTSKRWATTEDRNNDAFSNLLACTSLYESNHHYTSGATTHFKKPQGLALKERHHFSNLRAAYYGVDDLVADRTSRFGPSSHRNMTAKLAMVFFISSQALRCIESVGGVFKARAPSGALAKWYWLIV